MEKWILKSDIITGNKDELILKEENIVFQITPLNEQRNKTNNNISSINIDKECENILKEKYKINKNDILILLKYDYYIKVLYIPLIGYKILNPNTKEELDMS